MSFIFIHGWRLVRAQPGRCPWYLIMVIWRSGLLSVNATKINRESVHA
jgi:hypothetical protein